MNRTYSIERLLVTEGMFLWKKEVPYFCVVEAKDDYMISNCGSSVKCESFVSRRVVAKHTTLEEARIDLKLWNLEK